MTEDQEPESNEPEAKAASGLASFWAELKRRKVMRVAITYAVVAWLIMQVAGLTFEGFDVPIWAFRFVVIMLGLFFPVALIITWAFELTPDGIKTTKSARESHGDEPVSKKIQRKRNWMALGFAAGLPTMVFGALALYFFVRLGADESGRDAGESNVAADFGVLEKSIAVLPFTNLSPDDEHAYFADGIQETLVTVLTNLGDLRVVGTTSVQQYRDTELSAIEVAGHLGVRHILRGSVQRSGERFKLTAQLIDGENGNNSWAKEFPGQLTDVFAAQSQLASEIVSSLQAVLSPDEEERLARPMSTSLDAYELYLKALKSLEANPNNNSEAIELLWKAVAIDPDFIDAYHKIVTQLGPPYNNGANRNPTASGKLREAVEGVVGSDPDSPVALLTLGNYYYFAHLDFSRARFYLNQALELLPKSPNVHKTLAAVMRREGNWKDAVRVLEQAQSLDPLDWGIMRQLAGSYIAHRDYGKAARIMDSYSNQPIADQFWYKLDRAELDWSGSGSLDTVYTVFDEFNLRSYTSGQYGMWLYRSGQLHAFREEGFIDSWRESLYMAPFASRNGLLAHEQAVVLKLLGENELLDTILRSIIEKANARLDRSDEDFQALIQLGAAYALQGRGSEAKKAIDLAFAIRSDAKDALIGSNIALKRVWVLALIGDADEAVSEIERLAKKPCSKLFYEGLKTSLNYAPLRDHNGFKALLKDPSLRKPLPIINR